MEQYGWIKGTWGKTENNREAKFYAISKAGEKALNAETVRWRKMAGLVERLLNGRRRDRHGRQSCDARLE